MASVEEIQNAVHAPHVCEVCGSTFQYQLTAGQYNITAYGVRQLTVIPQQVYVCLCGEPIIPKNVQTMAKRGGEREDFISSVALARKQRGKNNLSKAAQSFASAEEMEEFRKELDDIKSLLNQIVESFNERTEDTSDQRGVSERPSTRVR